MTDSQMNQITEHKFGGGNSPSELITLQNANGLIAQFTPYGARWVSMWVPDSKGKLEDIILEFEYFKTVSRATPQEMYDASIKDFEFAISVPPDHWTDAIGSLTCSAGAFIVHVLRNGTRKW